MTEPRSQEQIDRDEAWLTASLQEHASSTIRDLVRDAVVLGPWTLYESRSWAVTLRRYLDSDRSLELTIWIAHSSGRFQSFRLCEITTTRAGRRVAGAREAIEGEL